MNKKIKSIKIFYSRILIVSVAIVYSLASQCAMAADSNLVSVEWLKEKLTDKNVLILDASPAKLYSEKHIPGARNINIYVYGVMETTVKNMEIIFRSAGISEDKIIVIYDQGGTILATRFFFSLNYYGFPDDNLFILDGGLHKWEEKGFPVTKEIPEDTKGNFTVNKVNEEARISLEDFITASGNLENNVLLEALDADWHYGKSQFFNKAGHIPNAIMMPAGDFFNPDKTFKTAGEIQMMLEHYGIERKQNILTHCGGGISASVPYFAIGFILKYPNVKLFIESELGWLKDPRDLPFWTYDAPYMMRETAWLKSWGGKMMQMYGISRVNIIDIRPEKDYNKGHFPYSVNIPSDEFKNNINNPAKLVEYLSNNGIIKSYESVIVSGSGLTKEAALAYTMLIQLGQGKVSIFSDTFEKSTSLGYKITTDTIKSVPVNYEVSLSKNIFVTFNETGKGLYSAIYIASGKNIPGNAPAWRIVNLPYSDFLNSDGSLKEAKDIWQILTDSGISRYSEIICFSEDPGEAAMNCFIFKLMGFPDVKIIII